MRSALLRLQVVCVLYGLFQGIGGLARPASQGVAVAGGIIHRLLHRFGRLNALSILPHPFSPLRLACARAATVMLAVKIVAPMPGRW
jgi:hypothetical protein